MPLDPQAAAFLAAYEQSSPRAPWEVSIAELRAAVLPVPGPAEPVCEVCDAIACYAGLTVPVRRYEPEFTAAGTCLYFHGGGWVTGGLDSHDALCRRLCNESSWRIIAVGYRLAPEHRFPAAVEDAYAACFWSEGQFPGPLAACGDSAGGNVAAALCLMARDRGGPELSAQALVYPVTDCGCDTESYRRNADGYLLTAEAMRWFWRQYAPDPDLAASSYASPLRAESLRELPRALVVTAEFDVLRDEGLAYAQRLSQSGIPVEVCDCDGMIHAFVRRLHEFDRAGDVCRRIGQFLRQAANTSNPPVRNRC